MNDRDPLLIAAKRVVETHTSLATPRHAVIEALKQLTMVVTQIEAKK